MACGTIRGEGDICHLILVPLSPWFCCCLWDTVKSLSEALLHAEHGENMLCTKLVLNVRNIFCTQHVLSRFELGIFMYWTCNPMNNLLSYCGLVDAKIRASDKDLPVLCNCNSNRDHDIPSAWHHLVLIWLFEHKMMWPAGAAFAKAFLVFIIKILACFWGKLKFS